MMKIYPVALAFCICASTAAAQEVRVTLIDGTVVAGEYRGYVGGSYRIMVSGAARDVAEKDVLDVAVTGTPTAAPPSVNTSEAMAASQRGEFEAALKKLSADLEAFEKPRKEISDRANQIYVQYVEKLVETRDAVRLAQVLRKVPGSLPHEARRALFIGLAVRYSDLLKKAPQENFTASLAETLAGLAEEGTLPEPLKATLSDLFAEQGDRAFQEKNFVSAAVLYQGAVRIDVTRRDTLKARRADAHAGASDHVMKTGDLRGAEEAARAALALDPAHAEGRRALEDAEFAITKRDAEGAFAADAAGILREFLALKRRPEHREWAEKALAEIRSRTDLRDPRAAEQMSKYFPARTGQYRVYRRAEGEARERVTTDSVLREGDVVKVLYTVEETRAGGTATRSYQVELEADAVVMATGTGRDPLLKFPLQQGVAWSWKSGSQEFRRSVRSLSETVTLSTAGKRQTFTECLVVDFTSRVERDGKPVTLTSRSSYAPGVGLVKLEYLDPAFARFSRELVEHGPEE